LLATATNHVFVLQLLLCFSRLIGSREELI